PCRSPQPTSGRRREGRRSPGGRGTNRRRGRRQAPARSPPGRGCGSQLPTVRPTDLAQQLHLRLELDAEALVHPTPALGHQLQDLGGGGVTVVLDEVGVLLGEAGTAVPETAASGRLQQLTRRATFRPLVLGVL